MARSPKDMFEEVFKCMTGDGAVPAHFDLRARAKGEAQAAWQGSRGERIAKHMESVRHCEQEVNADSVISSYSFLKKPMASSASLDALRPISVKELQMGQVHKGRVFYCRIVTRCSFMKSAMTLVEDADGDLAALAVYDYPRANNLCSAQALFFDGRSLAIIEPFFKLRADGTPGIRVDEAKDVVLDATAPCHRPTSSEATATPAGPSVEARIEQLRISEGPPMGPKPMHQLLRSEGFSISLKRLRDLLSKPRSSESASPVAGKSGEVGESMPTQPDVAAGSGHAGEEATTSGPAALVPERQPGEHRVLYGNEVLTHRDAGNAAFNAGKFQIAEESYTKALKAAKAEMRLADGRDGEEEVAAESQPGVPLWALHSNRCAARMGLTCPDKALQDAFVAHVCAPKDATKPIIRCAEAMAAMGFRSEAKDVLQSFAGSEDVGNGSSGLLQKQKELAPACILRVGRGEAYASIAAAVLVAPEKAEILVGAGVYPEPLIICKPLSIRSVAAKPGEDAAFCSSDAPMAEIRVKGMHAVEITRTAGPVLLEGFQIFTEGEPDQRRNAVRASSGVVVLQNCSLSSSSGIILVAENAGTRVIAKESAVHNGAQGGILALDNGSLALYNVSCSHAAASGLELRTGGSAYLRGCSVFANGTQGIFVWHGAGALEAENTEVHSNAEETGVMVEENADTAILRSCRLYGNGFCGLAVQNKGDVRLVSCEVHSNLGGILVQGSGDAVIERCVVRENRGQGIFIGYDHTGKVSIKNSKVCDNHSKGILLGTGFNDRVTLTGNQETGNRGLPCTEMPPSMRRMKTQAKYDSRRWAKDVQKSGGSFAKAMQASKISSPFDAFFSGATSEIAEEVFNQRSDIILACSFCKAPPGKGYCNSKCQKAHWKNGHKEECRVAPPKYPTFLDQTKGVDAVREACSFVLRQ
ncbi:unnamed protein product [Polarella glacialis]|uniref:Right handed beta helix domain-containing protein n=1 Tax=Polarella glacialis TaxID=89957 RepID=A0A813ECB9_POLGL|nr:unnamed protein product [Polarella glacialis]